jgi:hypothetical protein
VLDSALYLRIFFVFAVREPALSASRQRLIDRSTRLEQIRRPVRATHTDVATIQRWRCVGAAGTMSQSQTR